MKLWRFPIRFPSPGWIFAATVVLVVVFIPLRGWLCYSRQNETIIQFIGHARVGDFAKCRAMLAEDYSAVWLLDEQMLQAAADKPLVSDPVSCLDFLLGRRTFRVFMLYANDHSFTVSGSRVTLGSAFWWQYIPPGPEFKLTRHEDASEEYELGQCGEADRETVHGTGLSE